MDEKLRQLRTAWKAKHDEADALLRKDNPTGEDLTKSEALFDECDAIAKQIEDRQAELDRKGKLLDRSKTGTAWDTEPVRPVPFAAAGGDGAAAAAAAGFKMVGMQAAGHAVFDDQARLIEEAGPGVFGAKTWELLKSFEYKKDFVRYLRAGGGAKAQRVIDACTKTLLDGLDDQGGVFAPAELLMRVIGRLPAPTQLRALVQTLTTGRDTLIMPRKQYSADDKYTTAFRATWTGEAPTSDTAALVNDANLTGNVEIPVHTAMLVAPVGRNLVEDAAFPIQTWLESELNQVIDLLYEDMILNGTGIGQPYGLLNNPGATDRPEVVLSGAAGAIAYDGLIDMQTALAPQYENEGTRWVMNKKSTLRALMKLKDGSNRPLFATGVTADGLMIKRERVLLGDEIVLSQFMPDIGAANYPILYGDLKGYYLAQRVGFAIQVLDQTKAKQNQIELVGRIRFGGKPVEHWRMKIQKSNNA